MIRAGLCNQIDGLLQSPGQFRIDRMLREIDEIRSVAARYGLEPLRRLARGLETQLASDQHIGILKPWLQMMREAAGCDRIDENAAETFMAATSLRMGG